jgi:hypothetical protein
MKRLAAAALIALISAPAVAQQGATEIEHEGRNLINRWIAAFNKGDADAMAADIYDSPDKAKLAETFVDLRAESFGKLDVYSADFCGKDSTHGRGILKFARIYTFGGKMNDDESKIFDFEKTDAGWRITSEKDGPYAATLSCD